MMQSRKVSLATPGFAAGLPLVSVVIPNFNYGRYIAEAIDSVLAQGYEAIEVIVVDDASTDNSREVLSRYAHKVRLHFLDRNVGQIEAYNRGFALVQGEIVLFLDADDRLQPDAISTISKAFSPGVAKVHWAARLIDADGCATGQTVPTKLARGNMRPLITSAGILYPSPPGSANAYRKEILQQIMPLPTGSTERHGADFFTVYGSALLGTVAIAGEGAPLSDYRLHHAAGATGQSLNFGNAAQTYQEDARLRERSDAFSKWVTRWSEGRIHIAHALTEFSIEKNSFAHAIFSHNTYWPGFRHGIKKLGTLWRCLKHRPGSSLERSAIFGLCLTILVAPRRMGLPLARYLCNPSSR
jgi:glycosyltransferase involved in cell wall biosynthesis